MNRKRFERVKDILIAIRMLPDEEQSDFLDTACAGDPELREEVMSLLHVPAVSRPLLETGGVVRALGPSAMPEGSSPPVQHSLPEQIGPYRVLDVLGTGGMGVVYRALQGEPIERQVAIKVLSNSGQVDSIVQRFNLERQSLARMDHTNIARVYEAGSDGHGDPYFVMELVDGGPLTEYCIENSLPQIARLRMFQKVCRAVQHAHQKGVIHRDLKPSNILVIVEDGQAIPKVIDFGIAKAVNEEGEDRKQKTQAGAILGTLDYMSPEQARGEIERIDTRSDVYSLGAILYELLTGRPPLDLNDCAIVEALRRIREQRPKPPSTHSKSIDSDLDTIVLKALEKDPELRYDTASGLAEDIDRVLTNQPIHARPPSMTYQLRKLVRRHRLPVAFAAIVIMILVFFTITMSMMYASQRRERFRAEREAAKATRVADAMVGMLAAANPWQSRRPDVSVKEILDEASHVNSSVLEQEPEVQIAVCRTIGNAYQVLGLHDEAEKQLRRALKLAEAVHGEGSTEVAEIKSDLVVLILKSEGDLGEADELARSVIQTRIAKLGEDDPEVARGLNDLSRVRFRMGRRVQAESLNAVAWKIRRGSVYSSEFVETLLNQGAQAFLRGSHAAAESLYLQASDYFQAGGESEPLLAVCLAGLAAIRMDQGRYEEAHGDFTHALEIQTRVFGSEDPTTAQTQRNHALLLLYLGRISEAKAELAHAKAILLDVYGPDHDQVITTHSIEGLLLQCESRFAEAESLYLGVWHQMKEKYGDEDLRTAGAMYNVARSVHQQGRYLEAGEFYRQVLETRRSLVGEGHVDVAETELGWGCLLIDVGRREEAEVILRHALEVFESYGSWKAGWARCALGLSLAETTQREKAAALISESVQSVLEGPGLATWKRELAGRSIAVYEAWGEVQAAAEWTRLMQELPGPQGVGDSSM